MSTVYDANVRVEHVMNEAMRGLSQVISLPTESKIQIRDYLVEIIQTRLNAISFGEEEFEVVINPNMPINGRVDHVDIVIEYRKDDILEKYLINLNYFKEGGLAPASAQIDVYEGIRDLEVRKENDSDIKNGYYIFVTDWENYCRGTNRTSGTRAEVPIHNGYTISAGRTYALSGSQARTEAANYPNGFTFNNSYAINYHQFDNCVQSHWYFIVKI